MTWALKRIYQLWAEANNNSINNRNSGKSKHIVMVRGGGKASPSPMSATQNLLWRAARRMERGEL